MEKIYEIKGTELDIRDFGDEFNGNVAQLFLPENEMDALEDLKTMFETILFSRDVFNKKLSVGDLVEIVLSLRTELSFRLNVPLNDFPKLSFDAPSGRFFMRTGETMFFVPKIIIKNNVSH